MAKSKKPATRKAARKAADADMSITVSGFKSIKDEMTLNIRPLTVLAGANSSGKSSIMQPLLLMKQTIEALNPPGAFALNGSCLKYTAREQLATKGADPADFRVSIRTSAKSAFAFVFSLAAGSGIEVKETTYLFEGSELLITDKALSPEVVESLRQLATTEHSLVPTTNRFFLVPGILTKDGDGPFPLETNATYPLVHLLTRLVYVAGQRPSPDREFPLTTGRDVFAGRFDVRFASQLYTLESTGDPRIGEIKSDMADLRLAGKLESLKVADEVVEIRVGRQPVREGQLPKDRSSIETDTVSLADVGLGVSKALPVVVALRSAKRDQLVYLEEPELNLHPKAQIAMAKLLVAAANRGVRVVAETHSELMLIEFQRAVAAGEIAPDKVSLNWFTRDDDGFSHLEQAELDENGAYGEWPVDFGDVSLGAEGDYLDAVAERRRKSRNGH